MMKKTTVLYYSGASQHPYFIEEFKTFPSELAVTPSNNKYLLTSEKSKRRNVIASKTKEYGKIIKLSRKIMRNFLKLVMKMTHQTIYKML